MELSPGISLAFGTFAARWPSLSSSQRLSRSCRFRASADDAASTGKLNLGVNVLKYKSQRSILSTDKRDLSADEVDELMVKAGKGTRDLNKWTMALKGSYAVVFARLISDRRLVGFARATSDRALNGTIWDVVTDPCLPDETLMKRNVVKFLLKELRRTVPGCSIALFSSDLDKEFFESLDFVADPDGIKGMASFDDSQESYM